MINTVLLCPPDYYQIEYEINPWMHTENKVDYKRVREEYDQLVSIYKKLGLQVLEIAPQPGFPDMVYAANHGFVTDDIFIKANFRYPQRRKEAYFAEEFFKSLKTPRGWQAERSEAMTPPMVKETERYKIHKLPEDIFFEGQGDMFYRDGKFFCGYGKRTMKEAIAYMEKILRQEIITFQTNDPYFYHLDMCFAPLGRGKAIINPASFTKDDYRKIKKNFRKVIETDKMDNQMMCCNLVVVGDTIVLGKGISKSLKRVLNKEGFEIVETPTSEFFKGGGSVKCLTLEFFKS